MYATLSLKRLATMLGVSFGLVLIAILLFWQMPKEPVAWARTLPMTLMIWSGLLFLLFGFSGRWAPWRLFWWICPPLNDWLFPDLNGKWEGTTRSNFPVIDAMAKAAGSGRSKLPQDQLAGIALQEDRITLTIKASLFGFRISGKVANTKGISHSVTERVCKDKVRDLFTLYYVYLQQTPEPKITDEGVHPGAAQLDFDRETWTLKGNYWTRRSWRSGFNTAGLLELTRVSR